MLAAAKKNDIEEVEKCLKKKADIHFLCNMYILKQNPTLRRNGMRLYGQVVQGLPS